MAVKGQFSVNFYGLNPFAAKVDYSSVIEDLSFTTLSPGGFGTLQGRIRLADARLPRAELAMFGRVALIDPSVRTPDMALWLGEMSDPEYGKSDTDGEYMQVMALGLGASLRDDPDIRTYLK